MKQEIYFKWENKEESYQIEGRANPSFEELCEIIQRKFSIVPELFQGGFILFYIKDNKFFLILNDDNLNLYLSSKKEEKNTILILDVKKELKNSIKNRIADSQPSSNPGDSDNNSKKTKGNHDTTKQSESSVEEEENNNAVLTSLFTQVMDFINKQTETNSKLEESLNMTLSQIATDKKLFDHKMPCSNCKNNIIGTRFKRYDDTQEDYNICFRCYEQNRNVSFVECKSFIVIPNTDIYETELKQHEEEKLKKEKEKEDKLKESYVSKSSIIELKGDNRIVSKSEFLVNDINSKVENRIHVEKNQNRKKDSFEISLEQEMESPKGDMSNPENPPKAIQKILLLENFVSNIKAEEVEFINKMNEYYNNEPSTIKKIESKEVKPSKNERPFITLNNGKDFQQQLEKGIDYIEVVIPFATEQQRISVTSSQTNKSSISAKVTSISMRNEKITFSFENMRPKTKNQTESEYVYYFDVDPNPKGNIESVPFKIILKRSD